MKRSELKIGQRVLVIPDRKYTDMVNMGPVKQYKMWVRELHNTKTTGLSHRKNGKSIYGILYSVIYPIN